MKMKVIMLVAIGLLAVTGCTRPGAEKAVDDLANQNIEATQLGSVTASPGIHTVTGVVIDPNPASYHAQAHAQTRLSPVLDSPAVLVTTTYDDFNGKKERVKVSHTPFETRSQRHERQRFELAEAFLGGLGKGLGTGLSAKPPVAEATSAVDLRVEVE